MQIIYDLANFFGIPLLSTAETMPQLLEYLAYMLLAVYVVVITIRAAFNATWHINRI